MPAAFATADLILCRSGASTVSELAAAGRPAILVPFPFAADNHQLRNAEAFARTGAGLVIEDKDLTPERLYREVSALTTAPEKLFEMGAAAKRFAKPGAAARAVQIVEEVAVR
jgi:UDP-N-acetylglucosamine--N-acetylmuramyl-(pentapeptide) pyrophosphoryl-undecaprenol N-acetylglucosamine transferase